MKAHLYLRASTKDQDAQRALSLLQAFSADKGLSVAGVYAENISGTKLERPELFRLLEAAKPGDVLLCESVDRLSRLSQEDWESLKGTIKGKGLRLVVADLPTSHKQIEGDGIDAAIMRVINDMLIELMATMARLDQEKRVERIRQGLENKRLADPEWKPTGKKKNTTKHNLVLSHLSNPTLTMDQVAKLSGVGVATVYRIKAAQQA